MTMIVHLTEITLSLDHFVSRASPSREGLARETRLWITLYDPSQCTTCRTDAPLDNVQIAVVNEGAYVAYCYRRLCASGARSLMQAVCHVGVCEYLILWSADIKRPQKLLAEPSWM